MRSILYSLSRLPLSLRPREAVCSDVALSRDAILPSDKRALELLAVLSLPLPLLLPMLPLGDGDCVKLAERSRREISNLQLCASGLIGFFGWHCEGLSFLAIFRLDDAREKAYRIRMAVLFAAIVNYKYQLYCDLFQRNDRIFSTKNLKREVIYSQISEFHET